MVDVIGVLFKKRTALVQRRRAIEDDFKRQMEEVNSEIRKVDEAISTLNEATKDFLCHRCHGTGEIRRCDAAGQMEDWPCPDCYGTGVKPNQGGE